MRNSVIVLGLVSALGAGAAFANPVSDGNAQLAAQLGVNAADYSTGELAALWSSKQDGEAAVPYGAANGAAPAVARSATNLVASEISPARVQLAAQLGVNPADYSTAELAGLVAQLRDAD